MASTHQARSAQALGVGVLTGYTTRPVRAMRPARTTRNVCAMVIYSDPSRTWLRVTRSYLLAQGLARQVTAERAKQRGAQVFIDMDADYGLTLRLLAETLGPCAVKQSRRLSAIRSYDSFNTQGA